MQKYFRLGFVVVVLMVASVGLAGCRKKQQPEPDSTVTRPVRPPTNTIEISQRPYVSLVPTQGGRNVRLTLYDVKLAAQDAEYEMEYQTGDLLQGAFGQLDLETLPYQEDILLGSCSAGGKCSYHENVTGGELFLQFEGENEYALENGWAFIENTEREAEFSSRDGKFRLSGAGLARVTHLVIYNTPGLPENPEQALLSAPYAVGPIAAVTGQVEVSIRLNTEATTATMLGWDGEEWVSLETTVTDKVASATAPLYDVYVVVE